MYLKPEKNDAVLFGIYQSVKFLYNISNINVAGTSAALSAKVKLLAVSRSAHFHARALRHVRNVICNETAKSVVQALVSFRLDYANLISFGVSKQNITKLRIEQNTLARVVTRSSRYDSATIQLKKLQWLPIKQRIDFGIGFNF